MFDAPPECRAAGARGWVREQKTSGASHHHLVDCFKPTSHTFSQIKADEKTKLFLDAYSAQKMKTDVSPDIPRSYLHRNLVTYVETDGRGYDATNENENR